MTNTSSLEQEIEDKFRQRWNSMYPMSFERYEIHEEYAYTPLEVKQWFEAGAKWAMDQMKNYQLGFCDSCGEFDSLSSGVSSHDSLCKLCL